MVTKFSTTEPLHNSWNQLNSSYTSPLQGDKRYRGNNRSARLALKRTSAVPIRTKLHHPFGLVQEGARDEGINALDAVSVYVRSGGQEFGLREHEQAER